MNGSQNSVPTSSNNNNILHSTPTIQNQSTLPVTDLQSQILELERLNAELLQQREILANIQANTDMQFENENNEDHNLRLNNRTRRNNLNFDLTSPVHNQENPVNRARINNPVPLITAIANIPNFAGQPQTLQAFSKVLKDILEDYGPGCEKFILNSIPRHLKGRAYDAYGGIAPTYKSLDEFLQDLKLSFSGITDADTIKLDMRQMEQNPGEPVADYALRVQNLEQALHAIYESSVGLAPMEKINWKRRASEEALDAFLFGLKNPPEYRVAAKDPKTLREAANIAVNLEGRKISVQRHEFCSLKHIPFVKKEMNPLPSDDSSTVSSIATTDLFDLMAQLFEFQKTKDNMNFRVATTEQKKDCSICKSKNHEMAQCPDLLKAIELNSQKNNENKETEVAQAIPPNNYDNFPPPAPWWQQNRGYSSYNNNRGFNRGGRFNNNSGYYQQNPNGYQNNRGFRGNSRGRYYGRQNFGNYSNNFYPNYNNQNMQNQAYNQNSNYNQNQGYNQQRNYNQNQGHNQNRNYNQNLEYNQNQGYYQNQNYYQSQQNPRQNQNENYIPSQSFSNNNTDFNTGTQQIFNNQPPNTPIENSTNQNSALQSVENKNKSTQHLN